MDRETRSPRRDLEVAVPNHEPGYITAIEFVERVDHPRRAGLRTVRRRCAQIHPHAPELRRAIRFLATPELDGLAPASTDRCLAPDRRPRHEQLGEDGAFGPCGNRPDDLRM